MEFSTIWQVVVVVTLVLIVLGTRDVGRHWQQLRRELSNYIPVYSAETSHGKEAEFIWERLPKRLPKTIGTCRAAGSWRRGLVVYALGTIVLGSAQRPRCMR